MDQSSNKSTASTVVKGGLITLAVQGLSILLYFFSQRLILTFLTKEQNGFLFAERRMVDLLLVILVDFGLNGIVMRRIIQEPEKSNLILSSMLAFRMAMWIVATVLCLGVAVLMQLNVMDIFFWCLFLLFSSRSGLIRYALELPRRAVVNLRTIGIVSLMDPVFLFILVYLYQASLTPSLVILLYMISALPGFLVILFIDRWQYFSLRTVELAEIRRLVVMAVPIVGSVVLINLHDKIDAMLLEWLSDATQLGIYGAAYVTLSPVTGTIPLAISAATVPIIARLVLPDPKEGKRLVWIIVRVLIAVSVFVSAVASVATPLLVEFVSGGRYADNVIHFFVFLWMPIPIFLIVFIQDILVMYDRQKLNIPISFVLAFVVLIAGAVLIGPFGAMGAIVAKFVSITLAAMLALYFLHRVLEERAQIGLLIKTVFLIILSVGVATYSPVFFELPLAIGLTAILVIMFSFTTRLLKISDVMLVVGVLRTKTQKPN